MTNLESVNTNFPVPVHEASQETARVPRVCVLDLWEAFNDVAEGFGLTILELREMLQCSVKEYLGFSEKRLIEVADAVFRILDDDKNELIDALQCLGTLAILSGMSLEEKVRYIFAIYDFDESEMLSVDETILAFLSTVSGLCKVCGLDPPLNSELEAVALMAFKDSMDHKEEIGINVVDFVWFCQNTPEITSWILYCSQVPEAELATATFADSEIIPLLRRERETMVRPKCLVAGMDMDVGLPLIVEQEEISASNEQPPQDRWRKTAALLEPTVVPKILPSSAPDSNLELAWSFGFNSTGSRGAVFYTARSDVVFGAGSTGVVVGQGGTKQQFCLAHCDMISCVAVHHTTGCELLSNVGGETAKRGATASTIVATGELGARPRVLSVFRGFHTQGVCQLCFSPDGQLVVSVGKDLAHSVAVFHWRSRSTLFTAPSGPETVLACHFVHEDLFVSCGVNHLRLWNRSGGKFEVDQGIFGRQQALQPMLCCSSLGEGGDEIVVSGSASGSLYIWEGRNCTRSIKAHTGAITALARGTSEGKQGLVTGSTDGKVQFWTAGLEKALCIDVKTLGALSQLIHSLCWDGTNHKLLIATNGCEIFEVIDSDGTSLHKGPLLQGHFGKGVKGLATHPENPGIFATAGTDRTVRLWNKSTRRMVKMCVLDTPAQCICYSPNGALLGVGLGGGLSTDSGEWRDRDQSTAYAKKCQEERIAAETTCKKDGAWVVLREKDLTVIHEARDSKKPINVIRWSPDGGTLAVASEDTFIYLYNSGDYVAKAKCGGHTGGVTHLDFSYDGRYIQCDSLAGGDLLFFETERGDQVDPEELKDTEWETQSCVFGWPVQGAWGPMVDGCVLTSAARTNNGEHLATTDGYGRLRLVRYPAVNQGQGFREYRGHASPIRNCSFLVDDSSLLTSGGQDCILFLWNFEERADAEGAASNDDKGAQGLKLPESDVEVETLKLREERIHHPDLKDMSCWNQERSIDRIKNGDPAATMCMEENADEENFAPARPWHRSVAMPSTAPPEDLCPPDNDLILEWVHGYRGHDCRQSATYTTSGDVLFFAGTVLVRQDVSNKTQRFFLDHTDEVLCMAQHPSRSLVASGQRGRIPKVIVWDLDEMGTARVLEGFHRRAVTLVSFSPNGHLLATLGADDHHGLAVYDWESSVILCTTRTSPVNTLSLGFTLDSQGLILCADGSVDFWTIKGGQNMTRRPASLGPRGKRQPFLCQGWDGTSPVVGTYDGHMYRFLGRRLESLVRAHTSEVLVISSTGDGLVSGGADGMVKVWAHNLHLRHEISLVGCSLDASIRSVCWYTSGDRILVGTAGNELFEFNATSGSNLHEQGKPFLMGHTGEQLWGLACNPSAPEFCTVGEDKMLRIWDLYSKRCLRQHEMEMPSRAIAYSPDGSRIAVGFGLPVKKSVKQFDGKWSLLQEDDFQVIHAARDSNKHITDIKWAPSGLSLGIGAADGKIYVYNATAKYTLAAMLTTHNSPIVAIDFSADDRYIRSTCQASELFSHEADTGMVIPAASRLKNVEWDTQTVLFCWASQGVWPAQAGDAEVTSIDATLHSEHLNKAIAVGDNLGRIRLFRQPCTSAYADTKSFRGHGEGISRLRWSLGQSHLVSIGKSDRCIMQWRHERDDLAAKEAWRPDTLVARAGESVPESHANEKNARETRQTPGGDEPEDSDADPEVDAMVVTPEGALNELGTQQVEKQVIQRPWTKNMIEPSYASDLSEDSTTPEQSLSLSSIRGIRSQGLTRGALGYNKLGGLILPIASAGVVYSRQELSQRYFREHENKQIVAMSCSRNGRFVASGDAGTRPCVRVWDAATCVELCLLPRQHRQRIASLAFSHDARYLVTVGADRDKSTAIWRSCSGEWYDAELQATANAGRGCGHVFFAEFSVPDDDGLKIVSGGVRHVKFWTVKGRRFNSRAGLFGKVGEQQTMLCGTSVDSPRFVTGAVSGYLYVWKGRQLEKTMRAHQKCVNCLHFSRGGLVTGGKDGFVKLWSKQLAHLKTFDLNEAVIAPLSKGVRAVCAALDLADSDVIKIAAVTAGSELYEISRASGAAILLQEGHFSGQLWGLATHPTDGNIFATAGDDKSIRIWSISLGVMLRKAYVDGACRALAWSPDGRHLLIGMGGSISEEKTRKDGVFLVLDAVNMEVVHEGRDSRSWIRVCSFSPDGNTFALASADTKIYLYDFRSFALRSKAQKHKSPVLSLDFSEDSHYIQSGSEDNELLYHNGTDGSPFAVQAQLKHIKWAEYTCPFGWPVQGVWPSASEEPSPAVTSLHRSHDGKLVVAGDEGGWIKLFKYPVLSKQAGFKTVSGHVGGISCVRFTADDLHIVSIGKMDRSVFIWTVEPGQGMASRKVPP